MSGQEPPLVEFLDVSYRSRGEALLSAVSFAVWPHTVHVIVGPNGAGKTTVLSALLGQIPFEGRIVAHWRGDGRMGVVPQVFAVDPTVPVTVEDFLALTRQKRPVCLGVSAAARGRIAGLLGEAGLAGLGQRPLSVLSGGELRRVLLVHALDPRPELLILDEPFAGLDETAGSRLEALVRSLKRAGTTVLLVSHDLQQVARLADRVTVLDRRVVHEGSAADVLALDAVRSLPPEKRRSG